MSRLTHSSGLVSKLLHDSKMPAFTLYGSRGSTNTDRVRLTLAEGGFTDYELVIVNLQKGEQKVGDPFLLKDKAASPLTQTELCIASSASKFLLTHQMLVSLPATFESRGANAAATQSKENMKRHPWGKIPAITFPEGFVLLESRAICKYLARKYSFPLLPPDSDAEATALFDQAQSVEMLYFAEPAGRIAFEKFAKRFMGLPPDDAVVSDALRSVEAFFDVAERFLLHRNYMAGNEFTLADIYYVPLIQRLFACGYGDVIVSREAVSAWWDRCSNRPAIHKMLAADKEAAAAAGR